MSLLRRFLVASTLLFCSGAVPVFADGDPRPCPSLLGDSRQGSKGLAVALAGGGTKASSFSMGVLAALARERLQTSASPERASARALWQTDMVSTVSGGSYAGYFLFSRLIHLNREHGGSGAEGAPRQGTGPWGEASAERVGGYFADCLPSALMGHFLDPERVRIAEGRRRNAPEGKVTCAEYANAIRDANTKQIADARKFWNAGRPDTLHQQFLRCHQDLLAWQKCDFGGDHNDIVRDKLRSGFSGGTLALVNLASMPLGWMANLVFDWPVNLSPSRVAYRNGIGMVYGLRPLDAEAILGPTERAFNVGALAGAVEARGQLLPDPSGLTFAELARLTPGGPTDPPRWVIDATAAPSRHLLGWVSRDEVDLDRHVFSMSGAAQCAGATGIIPIDRHTVWDQSDLGWREAPRQGGEAKPNGESRGAAPTWREGAANTPVPALLTAVNASAAFFDANQQRSSGLARFFTAALLQTTNMNWGIDLRNLDENHQRRASQGREWLHEIPPFPAYAAEAGIAHARRADPVFVRLVDGGSADNLGAYVPIVAAVKDVIISDHAQDRQGSMSDLCYLRNELRIRRGLHLHVPGLAGWPDGCRVETVLRRSLVEEEGPDTAGLEGRRKGAETSRQKPRIFYPIWGWPYPFLAGCVSQSEDPASCLTEPANRLWIIKPAFDFPHWLDTQTCLLRSGAEGEPAASARADGPRSCLTEAERRRGAPFGDPQWLEREDAGLAHRVVSRCGDNVELPCESAAVLLRQSQHIRHPPKFESPDFPQRSTVLMTFDSNADDYGAYRELAHHYAKQAIHALDRVRADPTGAEFARILCWQGTHPIQGSADVRDLEFLKAWADIRLTGWDLATRNEARRGVGTQSAASYAEEVPNCANRLSAAQGGQAADAGP